MKRLMGLVLILLFAVTACQSGGKGIEAGTPEPLDDQNVKLHFAEVGDFRFIKSGSSSVFQMLNELDEVVDEAQVDVFVNQDNRLVDKNGNIDIDVTFPISGDSYVFAGSVGEDGNIIDFWMIKDGVVIDASISDSEEGSDSSPDAVPAKKLSGLMDISAEDSKTCAVKEDGTVWCWGSDNVAEQVVGIEDVKNIFTSKNITCAIKTSGELWCWGSISETPKKISATALNDVVSVAIVGDKIYAAEKDVGLFEITKNTPPTLLIQHTVTEIENDHVIVELDEGGGKLYARYEDGTFTKPLENIVITAEPITDAEKVYAVVAGKIDVCVLREDTSFYCSAHDAEPFLLEVLENVGPDGATTGVESGDVGGSHACIDRKDGSLWCSALIQGTNPTPVEGITDIIKVSIGAEHVCLIKSDKSAVCWNTVSAEPKAVLVK